MKNVNTEITKYHINLLELYDRKLNQTVNKSSIIDDDDWGKEFNYMDIPQDYDNYKEEENANYDLDESITEEKANKLNIKKGGITTESNSLITASEPRK